MTVMIWVVIYAAGGFAFWVAAFRVLASDPIIGVQASDSKHGAVESILITGFISLALAVGWPVVGVIFLVWKYAVAPAIKSREGDR